ncbi:hotdog family protein [Bordetella sp. FB-8]|uniref:ApeP family dehydratase n=1 Tax=Bordetella sp. FB-8 TaxID=1159870 RepID=UPI0003684D3D|nr:hotdog family protein [Bordetella sp. FB-8]
MTPVIPRLPMPAAELLPHSGDIVLLDEILSCCEDALTASVSVKPSLVRPSLVRPSLFSQADGSLPPWIGLEILAQAVAAWAGWQALVTGKPVRLGFLLGTRQYECHVDAFPPGAVLTVQVERTLQDEAGMGIFQGSIQEGVRQIAQARLNVYQPDDISRYTQESEPE